jgi:hypothetical protein
MGWWSAADGDAMPWLSTGDYIQYRAYTADWETQKKLQ